MNQVANKPGLPSETGFMCLMAALMSLAALSIDIMLPALSIIGQELGITQPNHAHLIITLVFIGMALGQLVFGPLSDSHGRKFSMVLGLMIFVLGSVIILLAPNFELLLLGRVVQGIGLGAPRTVNQAIMRDLYSGRHLARLISTVHSIFILVPMMAPALGQLILAGFNWRALFVFLLVMAAGLCLLFSWKMPETLPDHEREPLSWRRFRLAVVAVSTNRSIMLYSLASGVIFSAMLAYISSAAKLFLEIYPTGRWFGLIFASIAGSLAFAAFINGRLVVRMGIHRLVFIGLGLTMTASITFAVLDLIIEGQPKLWSVIVYLLVTVFAQGLLFGNVSALAMNQLHKNVGLGSMWIGFVSTITSVPIGSSIASFVTASPSPIVYGYILASATSVLLVWFARKWRLGGPVNY